MPKIRQKVLIKEYVGHLRDEDVCYNSQKSYITYVQVVALKKARTCPTLAILEREEINQGANASKNFGGNLLAHVPKEDDLPCYPQEI